MTLMDLLKEALIDGAIVAGALAVAVGLYGALPATSDDSPPACHDVRGITSVDREEPTPKAVTSDERSGRPSSDAETDPTPIGVAGRKRALAGEGYAPAP